MKKALGLLEIKGLATAILVADTMSKTANITITQIENTKGLGWMTIKITGDVGAVTAAVNAGTQLGHLHNGFVSAKIIPRPSDFVEIYFCHTEKEQETNKVIENIEKNLEEEIIEQVIKEEDEKGTLILEQKEEYTKELVLKEPIQEQIVLEQETEEKAEIILNDLSEIKEIEKAEQNIAESNTDEQQNENNSESKLEETETVEETPTVETDNATVKKSPKKRSPKPKTNQ